MKILLLSDIHANFPALEAVAKHACPTNFDLICNCGDTTVYAPFPNETIKWLRRYKVITILGNTDRKLLRLSRGKKLKKPNKPEKRIMYTWTMDAIKKSNLRYLKNCPEQKNIRAEGINIGLYHGSPEDPDEFLFNTTAEDRFRALAKNVKQEVVCVGHSHSPFYNEVEDVLFINPGSVGRMFDGNPAASYAIIEIRKKKISVSHHRVPWKISRIKKALLHHNLPSIYATMYEKGIKLN